MMFHNISEKSMYLESGECKPGSECAITAKEFVFLKRQGYVPEADPEPIPVKVQEPPKPKISVSNPGDTPETPTQPNTNGTPPPGEDEFGPIKGTTEWSDLSPTEKMLITRKRNQKYGPQ